ncbi:ribosome-associated protein [Catalinimonas alkaloidigena]|uniref:RNA-binding S4 domain-containing protein n=1 Tax=Catalinimonas alkaloidigena TaxID=1075417 RepID=UPI00240760A5|nr:RNA-binding S4 domain-containing protein [Catalinimonas alkaloidigena]MDF9801168.1 ribosome-associated protein [Catalinimonas alkaloidigena]
MMTPFKLKAGSEYIELNKLLKIMGWAGSGGEANQLIESGFVQVNGSEETQKRKKLVAGDQVTYEAYKVVIE